MKQERISDALNLLPDDMIEETDAVRNKKKTYRTVGWRLASAAACLAITVYAGVKLLPQKTTDLMPELPLLSIQENTSDGMGFEGYMAYDISELVNANPWNDTLALSTLPVFQNPLTYDENFIASGVDIEQMQSLLLDVAARLGLDTNTSDITTNYTPLMQKVLTTDAWELEVSQAMTASIFFSPSIALPDAYNFRNYASYEDLSAVAEYLQTEYADLIGFDNPQMNIWGGSYNIYAQQSFSIEFFDAGSTAIDQIMNYNFNRVAFYNDEDGNLFLARVFQPDLSQKVGDYPIITSKDATALLSAGNYLTTVPDEMPGLEYVKKVELIYRTGELETYFMPYYRFYVELPQEQNDHGLKTYGAYYVPAVNGAYLSPLTTWNGQFN